MRGYLKFSILLQQEDPKTNNQNFYQKFEKQTSKQEWEKGKEQIKHVEGGSKLQTIIDHRGSSRKDLVLWQWELN